MNEYDSARMADLMRKAFGMRLVATPEEADVILVNTCSVREKAEEKVYSELGRYRLLKQQHPDLIIGVGGCVAQQEGSRIQSRAPFVDIVFGPQSYHHLPELVKKVRRERMQLAVTDMPEIEKFDHLPRPHCPGPSAFVTVMEGCDKFCTFCIVPYTRGPELSRPVVDVLDECRRQLAAGAVEITLLGQNVNAYAGEGPDGEVWDLAMLLYAVAELPGLKRLRFTTSHPMEMNEGLIAAFAEIPQLMPYLHLPVQSGSDHMLRAMHRGHTAADYLAIVERLRRSCPEIALSSDFIVGFPGETDEDFAATLALVQKVGFASAFSFMYSPRPGTPAAKIADAVPQAVKKERLAQLQEVLAAQTRAALAAQIGKRVEVLVERPSRSTGDMQGRTPDFKIVHFHAPHLRRGQFAPVNIIAAYGQSLRGELAAAHDDQAVAA